MASPTDLQSSAASFQQFIYCELCRTSHTVPVKKHIYCKRHQEILRNILLKFKRKIQEACPYLKNPEVHDESWENGAKFWCYFCAMEVGKHLVLESVTIACAGFLEHIASKEHQKATNSFWWKHRIDKATMKHYVLAKEKLDEFHRLLPDLKEKFIAKMNALHKEEVNKLRNIEQQRKIFHQTVLSESAESSSRIINGNIPSNSSCHTLNTNQKIPPWLMDDDSPSAPPMKKLCPNVGSTSTAVIGPTMEDLKKHVEQERRKRLNPNRVGANFDHNSPTPAEWLPSFGRVWNFGRRWQSRQQYRKEVQAKKKQGSKKPLLNNGPATSSGS